MFANIIAISIAFTWFMNHLFVQAIFTNNQIHQTNQGAYQVYYVPNMPTPSVSSTHNRHLYTSNAMRLHAIRQKQNQLAEMNRKLEMNRMQKQSNENHSNTVIGSSTNERMMHSHDGQRASPVQLRTSGRGIEHISTNDVDSALRNRLHETGNGSKPIILTNRDKSKKVGVIGSRRRRL